VLSAFLIASIILAMTPGPGVPSGRGRGVGAALMQECVRRARKSGARVLSLHTTDMTQTAMRLYERMGFVRAPELDFQPAPATTVKGYRLDLTEAR
jgi:predicted N-acetyltransferase YhbS